MRNRANIERKITIKTYKASGLTTSNNTTSENIIKYIREQVTDTAGNSFITAGKYSLQGWVQLYEVFASSDMNAKAFATAVDGMVFGDTVLKLNTVNSYLGHITWAIEEFDDEDTEWESLAILTEFSSMTELINYKYETLGKKSPKAKTTKPSKVDSEFARIQKMSKSEQTALRKKLGW